MCTVVCTVRAATFSVILRGITGAGAAAGAGAVAGAEAVADGANKAMAERAKSEENAGAAAAAAASKQAAAFKVDKNADVVVFLIGGTPDGIGACTPSRSPCRRCVCFRCTC